VLIDFSVVKEKHILNHYFEQMKKSSDKTTNGMESVVNVIEMGLV
jgi:stalled ribosome rescue protein Dom34